MSEEINNTNPIAENHRGGVKTPEGKAISRYNAQKHAILRDTVTEYEKADAEQIYNDLADSLEPSGRFEELLIENIASNAIRLQRIAKAEAELVKESVGGDSPIFHNIAVKNYTAKVGSESVERLDLYSRYQTAAENRIYRALRVLREIKDHAQIKI